MKTLLLFCFLSLSLCIIGCRSNATLGERPPRYANSVQVALFDTASRPVNPDFEVFTREAEVTRPYKMIAILSRNANPEDQALMITAITWRAKQLGADAAILLSPDSGGWSSHGPYGEGGSRQPIYRAKAIVFKNKVD